MAKKRVYTGTYRNRSRTFTSQSRTKIKFLVRSLKEKCCSVYDLMMDYYLLFGTLFFVLVMTFVFPDLVHKINTSKEFNSLKRTTNLMSKEVSRAEVACLAAADDLCYLQCTMQDGFTGTNTERHDESVCTSFLKIRSAPVKPGKEGNLEKNFGFLRRYFYPTRSVSQQEITLMSYLYTNSLDAPRQNNTTS